MSTPKRINPNPHRRRPAKPKKPAKYIPLVEKYRPQSLDQVIGERQRSVSTILQARIQANSLPPCLLLSGPVGIGKTTVARIVAKIHRCDSPLPTMACGKCDSCKMGPPFIEHCCAEISQVNDMRKFKDTLRIGGYFISDRPTIFDEFEYLSDKAFAVLRKVIDEPIVATALIMCTNEIKKIPKAIRSRCTEFEFKKVDADEHCEYLKWVANAEGVKLSDDVIAKVARDSDGQVRDALISLENEIIMARAGS